MVDLSQYLSTVPTKTVERYFPGGYHPIRLGDRFKDGRYEILNKLGDGGFSTVWLARDYQNNYNVSLKVLVSSESSSQDRELAVFSHLQLAADDQHPGRKHVMQLLDSFSIDGPNGTHRCIVSEVLGPTVHSVAEGVPGHRLDGDQARQVCHQLLRAVDYIHSCGIAHGDIHTGNILFRCPEIKHMSPEEIATVFPPSIGKIERKDGSDVTVGFPECLPVYQVMPIYYNPKKVQLMNEIQLVDFGQSFLVADPPKSLETPLVLHPPELVFRRPLTQAVDIWNLGCTTLEILTGRLPFYMCPGDKEQELVPQFRALLGNLPAGWIADAINRGVLEDISEDSDHGGSVSLDEDIKFSYRQGFAPSAIQLDEEDLNVFVRYVQRMLVLDPAWRATASELLQDPWFLGKIGKKKGNSQEVHC
ncbi:kinase-like protein [Periconia macrospinosa]|uniref:Kinase-like protein n=1 Tax=Periconia macrospinosa TaxID=97972 RepID=A0A2V1DP56_9PLEO|nr:kinase-like protein [Periconia macrospinosa]